MRKYSHLAALLVALLVAGCYHATVLIPPTPTQAPVAQQSQATLAGGQTITKWAHGWILGLVPPGDVDTKALCPNGATKVETQLSFANQLVAWLTSYIYTPMTIAVTCAIGPAR